VHPAEIEIEAIACLEAITCGLVHVIANSPRCATKAFAMGNNNLFENKNSDDLASKIDYWIENPKEKDFNFINILLDIGVKLNINVDFYKVKIDKLNMTAKD
jgi:hypothetical protein